MDKSGNPESTIRISNQFSASSACEHCQGIIRHEPFCITLNTRVLYAYEIIVDACKLTPGDQILLHGMSVAWEGKLCAGKSVTSDATHMLGPGCKNSTGSLPLLFEQ
jgi:hypothetical protein